VANNDYETSPSAYLSAFQTALQTFATSPSSTTAAQAAVTAAQELANSLNEASDAVQAVRQDAEMLKNRLASRHTKQPPGAVPDCKRRSQSRARDGHRYVERA